jgi:integrase
MILVAYRHAMRASEITELEWSAIDFDRAEMHVTCKKSGTPSTHPLRGHEMRELRKLRKSSTGPFVFTSERGAPFTAESFNFMVKRAGQKANLAFRVHAHMLRHSTGFKLASDFRQTLPF